MKTKTDIIMETKSLVEKHGRCINEDQNCAYRPPEDSDHPGCALGRVIRDESYHPDMEGLAAHSLFSQFGYNVLEEEYRIKDDQFWDDVQKLHDRKEFWVTGNAKVYNLNEAGKAYFNLMLRHYED